MQNRRKGRKRAIKLIKDQEQSPQDKLLEISSISDKFVDQSHMLSIQHKIEEKLEESRTFEREVKDFGGKPRYCCSKVKTENGVAEEKDKTRSRQKKPSVLIANKLESNQVFVGFKPRTSIAAKLSDVNFLTFDKQKTRTLSTLNHFQSKSIPVRRLSTQLSNKLDFCILMDKKRQLFDSVNTGGGKVLKRGSQKLQALRARIRTELFFSNKYKQSTKGSKTTC